MHPQELIDRLEKATAPSFHLECQIMYAVHNIPSHQQHPNDKPPAYMCSIDAALTAGEPGWEYSISTLYGIADVEIPLNDSTVEPVRVRREHGHVPTALCEAIMKARAAPKQPGAK